ncbi:manganese efflux pump MntP family protein [Halosquirtibacter laminarini]|uniref:Manganese efflux pump MntP family protein n=1 Tax=Halosquirtibacter laminarini TaxID=3374600 RepID=A0AC61NI71_9BACT|nr:manganese efflux pump MntP family protein [Prolixibacteraceae bacterium]
MSLFTIIFIAIGLSIDSLAASISMGACATRIRKREVFRIASYMALFQGGMPVIGWLVGSSFKSVVQACDHWIAFSLLLFIGGKLIFDGIRFDANKACGTMGHTSKYSHWMLMGVALATSIDAMIVGVGFALEEVNITLAMAIIALITFTFSSVGVTLGRKLGNKINSGIEIFGGVVLIAIGVKILISHLCM